jgi:hypothetical protein
MTVTTARRSVPHTLTKMGRDRMRAHEGRAGRREMFGRGASNLIDLAQCGLTYCCEILFRATGRGGAAVAYRTILVELVYDSGLEARLRVARILARRYGATLVGMHVMPPPFILTPYAEAAAFVGPDLIEAERAANREIRDRIQEVFRSFCGDEGSALWREG